MTLIMMGKYLKDWINNPLYISRKKKRRSFKHIEYSVREGNITTNNNNEQQRKIKEQLEV